jgi:hypothetical protein
MREDIDQRLKDERGEISSFLQDLSQNNYELQSLIL